MKHVNNRTRLLPAALVLAALAGCDGSTKVGNLDATGRAELLSVEVGRLVDVYSYRRIDTLVGDRRLRANRQLELIAKNVVINANIESQSLFDAAGNAVPSANYEYLPFDKTVGHEQLLILWDDREGDESQNFAAALASAQTGLQEVPASYRGQNTATRPIPIVPRNAAIKLRFSEKLSIDSSFFAANPEAVQLLEFKGDPGVVSPVDAFRILPSRVLVNNDALIVDTTILAGEAGGVSVTTGLPVSDDNVTANIRIALPVRGQLAPGLYVREDAVAKLNDVDSAGRASVVRDFRSGNLADGVAGRLREPEAPMIVASLGMGISAVNGNVITLNKRNQFVPVRGRYPFVDGPLTAQGLPTGPLSVPTQRSLKTGDFLTQNVQVELPDGSVEVVALRAEILENLTVNTVAGTQGIGLAIAPLSGDSGQGELTPVVQVRVATVNAGRDSLGRPVAFTPFELGQTVAQPQGRDCVLRSLYYESVPLSSGAGTVSDRAWRNLFVRIDPKPTQAAVDVQPNASVAVEFTKPMDLDQVDNTKNLLITSRGVVSGPNPESFAQQTSDPKRAKARLVTTRLSDLVGDGTILRLQPPMGFFHQQGLAGSGEVYSIHVRTGGSGVTDLAGNTLQLFDELSNPQDSWSVDFQIAGTSSSNLVGWINWIFEAEDEDGSRPGSADLFGQYRLENGRLFAASAVRVSRSADSQNLPGISRILRGECWDTVTNLQAFPTQATAPTGATGAVHPGLLYWEPRMSSTIAPPNVPAVYDYNNILAQPVGRVIEPLKPQGSRMQMRYIEDDFSLSYTQANDFALDVEQLYWSPYADETVLFDVFDRFTMSLSHARTRPDERWFVTAGEVGPPLVLPLCTLDCASMNSGLSTVFSDNVLNGTAQVPVFEDKVYTINPNSAFRSSGNVKYVPFPRFDRTYTWRDSRLVTVDASGNVIGLGGAQQPNGVAPNNDVTAFIDSPWIESQLPQAFRDAGGSMWVIDDADFRGTATRDHDPIALPLLVDFKIFADGAANGIAAGNNGFQVAMLGSPPAAFPGNGGGYYDGLPAGCPGRPAWPRVRVQASGGFDQVSGAQITIDPANQLNAQATWIKDAGMGDPNLARFLAPAGDGMMNWARADFVRKVSTMTFGFFDTLRPQFGDYSDGSGGFAVSQGVPNLLGLNIPGANPPVVGSELRINDLVIQLDPPLARQPAGTSVVAEIRGAESFGNSTVLYNPAVDNTFNGRGNLLNPSYACEAYRYSTANLEDGSARVQATRLTRYVTEDQLSLLRDPATNLLPRLMNLRLTMTNNVSVTPALSPSLRSVGIVYRMQMPQ